MHTVHTAHWGVLCNTKIQANHFLRKEYKIKWCHEKFIVIVQFFKISLHFQIFPISLKYNYVSTVYLVDLFVMSVLSNKH